MIEIIITALVAVAAGGGAGFVLARNTERKRLDLEMSRLAQEYASKEEKLSNEIQHRSEELKKRKIQEARDKFQQLKADFDQEYKNRNQQLQSAENKARNLESTLQKKIDSFERKEQELDEVRERLELQRQQLADRQAEMEQVLHNYQSQLEKLAGLSTEDARNRLIESLTEEARTKAKSMVKELTEEARLTATREARKVVLQTIQRVATEQAIENSISVFNIDNDELKGRIIGREGRNIRALEAATGVEIIVDDTPEAIILSAFDPVRREVARLALHRLVTDGRIHPARIEEVVEKTRKQIEEEILEIGERTCIDLGIHGLHTELVKLVGKMRYRSSYGQNLLQHSREVANLCSIMASELGMNVKLAKRAGLLHDIGKVSEEDPEMPHALLGAKLAERYKEHPAVINAIGAHHDEMEMTDPISPIIQVCDGISGARPGARREIFESYIKRLKDMEAIATSYEGVQKSYAIQAGRELRVIVESEKITDSAADELAFDISTKIQDTLTYPGQIKVTVIREKRAIAFAR